MPRKYISKIGARSIKTYKPETLEKSLKKVLDGKISLLKASKIYKIPLGTLYNRVHGKFGKEHGGQKIFLEQEENYFASSLLTCAQWGFPFSTLDLRLIAKAYLDEKKVKHPRLQNNLPGVEWARSFLNRHKKELSLRTANNIKRARASVDSKTLGEYHDEVSKTLSGVKPEAIFNYDESNLSDDPGKAKLIFKRGVKYPDNVINFSKSAVSIMLCSSASGTILPPYVVYKAANMWDTWREGGPKGKPFCSQKCCAKGTRYNRSDHGWFDAVSFSDWFFSLFLPHAKLIEGKKVLIGDNLSSHFTPEVLRVCQENNIAFVCLPPNATHLCQPLDVSFFGPMKREWKKLLTDWKKHNPNKTAVDKSIFPRMLKKIV